MTKKDFFYIAILILFGVNALITWSYLTFMDNDVNGQIRQQKQEQEQINARLDALEPQPSNNQ